jgi:Tfp pilus assembly protein PilF/peroxiredoxin
LQQPTAFRACVLTLALLGSSLEAGDGAEVVHHYHARLRPPASLASILEQVAPGHDDFPEERAAAEIGERLAELSRLLRAGGTPSLEPLLAPDFKGSRLRPLETATVTTGALEVTRSSRMSEESVLDRAAFAGELEALTQGMDQVRVAEFLVTRIESPAADKARTQVRFDLVGSGAAAYRTERVGHFVIDWRRDAGAGWRAAGWRALDEQQSRAAQTVFREVTEAALGANDSFRRQLSTALDPWLATLDAVFMMVSMGHHGVSAGDADGDGRDDLFVAQPAGLPDRLFRNKGDGTFEDVTEQAGLMVLDETSQALFADVDNDGDQDLILVVTGSGLLLFRNDGKGHFSLDPDAFHLKLAGTPMSIAMADYDRDGFLDIYLCNYSYFIGASEDKGGSPNPYHDAQNGPPNLLLHNEGGKRFVDATAGSGLDQANDRFSFAAAWADYDEDGWPDLLVANDFGRKNLYHNEGLKDGKVTFRDMTAQAGVEDHGAGMSATWLDYDGDGRLDIYTGNMWSANGQRITHEPGFMPQAPAAIRELYRRHARGNSLFRNKGDGTFEDVTLGARAEMGRWAWSSDAVDFDRDGWPDLYVVNGMFTREPDEDLDAFFWRQVVARSPTTRVTGTPYEDAWRAINRLLADKSQASHERDAFLRNDGHGGFDEVGGSLGLDLDQDGRSFAVLDYDGDGAPDLAVMAARQAPQLRLFRNEFKDPRAGLALRLRGTKSNRDAVGARVTVETDRLRVTRLVQAGSGFISQHSKELLFGLGDSHLVVKLEVRWPSGATQTLTDVPLDRRVFLDEGGTPRYEPFEPAASAASAAPPSSAGHAPGPPSATWLYERYPAPDFGLTDLDGKKVTLASLRGHPALLLFWTTDAEPSVRALHDLSRAAARLRTAGASLMAVSLDEPSASAKVRAAAQTAGGLELALGSEELGATYTLLNRYLLVTKEDLRLPTLLLLDASGEIARLYRGRIDADELLADLGALDVTPAERLRRAFPFAGRLYGIPGRRNSLQLGLELVEQGIEAPALVAFERAARGTPNAFTLYSLGTLYMKGGQSGKARSAFERALELKPDFAEASNGLGALLGQGGNLPGAIARFQAALAATPHYPDALNNMGYALLQSGRDAEAYPLFQKALELQPDFAEAENNLGIYAAKQRDPAQAVARFRKAVELRPGYGEAANNLALVLMASGDVPGATAALQNVLQANPAFEMSYVTLAKLYLSTGRRREATQVLERLLQRNPQNPLGRELLQQLKAAR